MACLYWLKLMYLLTQRSSQRRQSGTATPGGYGHHTKAHAGMFSTLPNTNPPMEQGGARSAAKHNARLGSDALCGAAPQDLRHCGRTSVAGG
jgi:hypothetical protein